MTLATKQIIENSNDTEAIKGVGEQFAAIQQSLEKAFQSQDALAPEEALTDLLSIYNLYLYIEIESETNRVQRFKSLEEIELRAEAFKTKYKDFAPKEAVDGIENVQLWAKISRKMISSKVCTLAASVEDNEVKQLGLFYTGLINLLDIAENYLSFFTQRGRELAKAIAQAFISYKTFEDYAKKRPADEITSGAISIRNAAKAILWEIDRHDRKKFSYKSLYEAANNALKTDDKEDLLKTLRSWREEDINELKKLSDN
ncbi:hypothetical protein IQ270_21225 [Microcoleus sp. LEGE 07076]|uniref:hypothetical protein n=1 Tax=Microcoleus sp. LEGE 07076 TaxID=915322 RepID=UPI0018814779|nr:hypothetical protein [Microcoleus sp. LEGE 07076]MBE9187108.1 hypothetical protein [Microcoleus sp. LEGE 07076]